MTDSAILPCDGCGQPSDPKHVARRLQRLEWSTRFRPIHVQALLLTASSPDSDADFLYSPAGAFSGEAGRILAVLGISATGKPSEEVLGEFQRRGLVLASILECPLEPGQEIGHTNLLVEKHLPHALARIRRSIKPKRVLVLSPDLEPVLAHLSEAAIGCPVFYTPLTAATGPQAVSAEVVETIRAALPPLAASYGEKTL